MLQIRIEIIVLLCDIVLAGSGVALLATGCQMPSPSAPPKYATVALCNRETIYIFMLWFVLLSSFFPRLISAVGDWMFTMLWHMVWP